MAELFTKMHKLSVHQTEVLSHLLNVFFNYCTIVN